VNEALARRRRRRLEAVPLDAPAAAGAHDPRPDAQPEAASEATDAREHVLAALAQLPFDFREAVVLRDLAGLSNEEVAQAIGLTVPAAKSRIHRGRLQLRELLDPESS
jgi:RNA polymerase sigma-70 factor (ECF subfamily)